MGRDSLLAIIKDIEDGGSGLGHVKWTELLPFYTVSPELERALDYYPELKPRFYAFFKGEK